MSEPIFEPRTLKSMLRELALVAMTTPDAAERAGVDKAYAHIKERAEGSERTAMPERAVDHERTVPAERAFAAIAEDLIADWTEGKWCDAKEQFRIHLLPKTRRALERAIVAALQAVSRERTATSERAAELERTETYERSRRS